MITRKKNYDLTKDNTFGLSMRARTYIEYDSVDALHTLWNEGVLDGTVFHIGAGSNQVFDIDYFDGTVLHSAIHDMEVRHEHPDGSIELYCGSGLTLDEVAAGMCAKGLYGLENLSGIPGEVGAGAVQNVGAYGVELADRITGVELFDTVRGESVTFSPGECGYGYRTSRFKEGPDRGRYIVTGVLLRLTASCAPVLTYGPLRDLPGDSSPADIRARVLGIRESKLPDPAKWGSAGSYFTNPVVDTDVWRRACSMSGLEVQAHPVGDGRVKLSAAWLIDRAGLKEARAGGAALWPSQPLVLYNAGGATASDVLSLASHVSEAVLRKFGIELRPEVQRASALLNQP